MTETKTCNTCGEAKAHELFPKHRNQCKVCHYRDRHTKYPDDPRVTRERANLYRKKNIEKVKTMKAVYRKSADEKFRAWNKTYSDKNRKVLGESYVKLCIANICNVSRISIPIELVESKRKLLLIFRKIKEMRNV